MQNDYKEMQNNYEDAKTTTKMCKASKKDEDFKASKQLWVILMLIFWFHFKILF